ncbi:MAG: hypothetical protein ABSB24_01145 [Gaiellaceae bacterium]
MDPLASAAISLGSRVLSLSTEGVGATPEFGAIPSCEPDRV